MKRRNTPAKNEILKMFQNADVALSQDMIEQQMKGTIDRVTIYRILNSFNEDGIIHKVTSDEGKQYYALCTKCDDDKHSHDHFHFRCLSCNTVECLETDIKPKLPRGYQMENANLLISGYCNNCNS